MSSSTVGVGADDLVTGEAVALDLPSAGIGLRIVSGLIDYVLGMLVLIGLQIGADAVFGGVDDALTLAMTTLATIAALVALPTTFETLTRGKTLGHLALGLRTVRDDAGPIRFRQALTRAMLGVVEVYGCSGVPALVSAAVSSRGKRLGDLLAGTYVVRDRQRIKLTPPTPMPPQLAGWAATADLAPLPDQLAVAVRQFLARAHTFAPPVREQLGARLLDEARPYVAPAPPPGHHAEYVLMAMLAERRTRDADRLAREARLRERLLPPDPVGGVASQPPSPIPSWGTGPGGATTGQPSSSA
ncbi:RDD family protein [Phycicoccus sp. M110.8]|uniref:RDD family protein n=1 Tax=Phycicoccus sp. M110.8 TaxID=3075433 RepID=UPI0028FD33CE|nr:RDD family protein [Phycicoccus sp. M110.8]MDU0312772.1 RDD family protein [Phycicoccus sp. M110.8]